MLLPVSALYLRDASTFGVINTTQSLMPNTGVSSLHSVILMQLPEIPQSPLETITDLIGIFFYPATGNVSISALTPLFFVMVIVTGILLVFKRICFSPNEKKFISLSLIISLAVFFAYARMLHILNTDPGITPDIRYLSPAYLPLMVIGLILLKKSDILPENSSDSIKRFITVSSLGLVISIIFLPLAYSQSIVGKTWNMPAIGKFFSLYALAICMLGVVVILYNAFFIHKTLVCEYLVYLLCSIPFFWQVNEILMLRSFSGFAGHIFWIPVMRVLWDWMAIFIIFKNVAIP